MHFIYLPKKVYVGAVWAEGETELNAFDNCLVKLGIGNVSLVKATSILPKDVEIVERLDKDLDEGANVPAIYALEISSKPGERIVAGLGIARTDRGPTLVAEFHGRGLTEEDARHEVFKRLEYMAKVRGIEILEKKAYVVEHVVEKVGCVLAIAVEIE